MRRIFNKALKLLLASNGFVLLAAAMLGPIYAIFVEGVGGDILDASLAGGLFALAAGLTTLVAGKWADSSKRPQYIVAFGYLLMTIGFALYIFVDSIFFLFAVQVVIGIGEALYSPAFDVLYSRHLISHNEGKERGAREAVNYFSYAIGAAVGGFIAKFLGFNVLFGVMAGVTALSAVVMILFPSD